MTTRLLWIPWHPPAHVQHHNNSLVRHGAERAHVYGWRRFFLHCGESLNRYQYIDTYVLDKERWIAKLTVNENMILAPDGNTASFSWHTSYIAHTISTRPPSRTLQHYCRTGSSCPRRCIDKIQWADWTSATSPPCTPVGNFLLEGITAFLLRYYHDGLARGN
jgi:hypothetical protein